METFATRQAKLTDLDTLVHFVLAEATEAEGSIKLPATVEEGIRRGLLDSSISQYWVLENKQSTTSSSKIVGSISIVREWSDWHAGFYWWIQSMFLLPDYRGKGLMKPLLDAVKEAATRDNVLELRLYVHKENQRAIKAYQREGFGESNYKIMSLEL
jgi:RimJ/RimL family protein N-acetyltransferase